MQVNIVLLAATLGFGATAMALLVEASFTMAGGAGAPACLLYGVTLEASALFSFLYNVLGRVPARAMLRFCDHSAIFLLIAGTYTPLVALRMEWALAAPLLTTVWCLAGVGIVLKFCLSARWDRYFVYYYLALGLAVLVVFDQIIEVLPLTSLFLLGAGGVAFLIGAVIYLCRHDHWTDAIWHALVLVGATCHFFAIYSLVAPA
ncbi:MAG TPA: hemolysin III family protein [Stellaceae bacterium]|nr:hemolysin III family protein [Stellaceae bacterium]